MKRIGIALAILILLFSATLLHSTSIEVFSSDLTALLEAAEENAEQGDWTGAKELTQNRDFYLHITLRHSETDSVYMAFREVSEFIECQEGGEYSAANAKLIAGLELLAEAEQLTLKNIF